MLISLSWPARANFAEFVRSSLCEPYVSLIIGRYPKGSGKGFLKGELRENVRGHTEAVNRICSVVREPYCVSRSLVNHSPSQTGVSPRPWYGIFMDCSIRRCELRKCANIPQNEPNISI